MASSEHPEVTIYRWSSEDHTKRVAVHNPATGKLITTVQAGNASTVSAAVEAAHNAYVHRWRPLTPSQRSSYLFSCAAALESHADAIAELLCLENGKPVSDARLFDVNFAINCFRYFGSLVDKLPFGTSLDRGALNCTVHHEPLGVVAGILPFNWPPIHTAGKLAPALAAGNTMILKPGEQAPLTVAKMVEILQTVLPEDVVQIVPGAGPEVPNALVTHPLIRAVSFTGSTAAGAKVAAAAADVTGGGPKKTLLELGGKNAFVVFEDADLDRAVRDALDAAFFNKGEACTAGSRLLVQRGVYEVFVGKLGRAVGKLRLGDGMKKDTHIGPQVSREQRDRVMGYIKLGKAEGARVAAQARMPEDPACADGFFVPATLFADVTEDMRIAREEMFGAIVTATPFETFDDAVRIVNSSEYGLTAAVYTRDMITANRAARIFEVGMVWVNNYHRNVLGTPFGGVKASGYGREHCIETLYEWMTPKAVHSLSGNGDVPTWRVVDDVFGPSGSEALQLEN